MQLPQLQHRQSAFDVQSIMPASAAAQGLHAVARQPHGRGLVSAARNQFLTHYHSARLLSPAVMFIVAVIGVACNALMMLILGHHHHGHACSGHSHGPAHAHAHPGGCGSGSGAACELAGGGSGSSGQPHVHAQGCCGGQLHSRHRYAAAPAADVEAGERLPLSSHGMLHAAEEEADGDYVLSAFLPILGAAGAPSSDAGDPDQHAKQAQQQRQSKQREQQLGGSEGGGEGDAAAAALKGSSCGHGNMNMRGEAFKWR